MNRRPNKLFPLVLLALLAGLTFWLQSLTDWLSASVSHDKRAEAPDYVVEGFTATVFDAQGQVKQHLSGQQAWQQPNDPTIHLLRPHLRQYAGPCCKWKSSATMAAITRKPASASFQVRSPYCVTAQGRTPPNWSAAS